MYMSSDHGTTKMAVTNTLKLLSAQREDQAADYLRTRQGLVLPQQLQHIITCNHIQYYDSSIVGSASVEPRVSQLCIVTVAARMEYFCGIKLCNMRATDTWWWGSPVGGNGLEGLPNKCENIGTHVKQSTFSRVEQRGEMNTCNNSDGNVLQVNGGSLPSHVIPFCAAAAALAAMLPLISYLANASHDTSTDLDTDPDLQSAKTQISKVLIRSLPSGIGFAVGMYVAPKWTIPRVIGSLVEQGWLWWRPGSHASLMVVVASGLVLGEGTASIFTAVLTAVRATAV